MFTPEQRKIFPYHNGERDLYADPYDAELKLRKLVPTSTVDVINDDTSDDAAKAAAKEKLIAGVRQTFGMQPFDPLTGKGATARMCDALWDRFWEFSNEKKSPLAS